MVIFRVYVSLPRSNYCFHPNLRCLKLKPPPYVPGSKDGQTMINIGICLSYENGLMTIPLYQESTQRPWHLSCLIQIACRLLQLSYTGGHSGPSFFHVAVSSFHKRLVKNGERLLEDVCSQKTGKNMERPVGWCVWGFWISKRLKSLLVFKCNYLR